MSEIKITYETLFDILRRERNREELQELEQTFFEDVLNYIYQKQTLMKDMGETISSETEKAKIQYYNIQKILRELYDRREKKIIMLAMNAVRTDSELTEKSAFLPEEKAFFQELTEILRKNRNQVLNMILGKITAKKPVIQEQETKEPEKEEETPKKEREKQEKTSENIKIIFIKAVPKFAGGNNEVYGPYTSGDKAHLPEKIARLLIRKGRAKETA